MTGKQMAAHIDELTAEHGITVGDHSRGGRAWRKSKRINIRPVKTAITYAVALHEIGHVVGPKQSGRRLERELAAWQWARQNAKAWSPAMTAKAAKGLNSYINRYRRHKTAIVDEAVVVEINQFCKSEG